MREARPLSLSPRLAVSAPPTGTHSASVGMFPQTDPHRLAQGGGRISYLPLSRAGSTSGLISQEELVGWAPHTCPFPDAGLAGISADHIQGRVACAHLRPSSCSEARLGRPLPQPTPLPGRSCQGS